jgi:bifunctional UDP-N-acetylglucosamine pyrophosphorylase/glucosamine-1-phosphate N-acetyltransferase
MDPSSGSEKRPLASVILAAGDSKRMKSSLTKVLHPLAGRKIIEHVVEAVNTLEPEKTVVIVGKDSEKVLDSLSGYKTTLINQGDPLGTAHALLASEEELGSFVGDILVLCGDTPLIRGETLDELLDFHRQKNNNATLLTCLFEDARGYGRIIRTDTGNIMGIVEEVEASAEERDIKEINTGMYCFKSPEIFGFLEEICSGASDKEYYLTDVVEKYNRASLVVNGLSLEDEMEVMGINTRIHLASAENAMRDRIRNRLMEKGVTLVSPSDTFIDVEVEIGRDTVIYPFVVIEGKSRIGEGSVVGSFCRIVDSKVGRGSRLKGWNNLKNTAIPEQSILEQYSGKGEIL